MSKHRKAKLAAWALCLTVMTGASVSNASNSTMYIDANGFIYPSATSSDAGSSITTINLGATGKISAGTLTLGGIMTGSTSGSTPRTLTSDQLGNIEDTISASKTVDASSGLTLGNTSVITTGAVQGDTFRNTSGTFSVSKDGLITAVGLTTTGGVTVDGSITVGNNANGKNIAIEGDNGTITGAQSIESVALTTNSLHVGIGSNNIKLESSVDSSGTGHGTVTVGNDSKDQTIINNGTVTASGAITGGTNSMIGGVSLGDNNTSGAVSGVTLLDGATVTAVPAAAGTSGGLAVSGVTLNNGSISAVSGTFSGAITGGKNSTIGGVSLGDKGIFGAVNGIISLDGATVLADDGGGLTVSGITLHNGSISAARGTFSGAITGGNNSTIGGVSLGDNNTSGAVSGVASLDGAAVSSDANGGLAISGVTLHNGSISAAGGNFKVDSSGAVTGGTNSTIGGVSLGTNNTSGAVSGVTSLDGAAVSSGTNGDLTVSGVTLNQGVISTGNTANTTRIDKSGMVVTSNTGSTNIGADVATFTNQQGSTSIQGDTITTDTVKTNTLQLGNGTTYAVQLDSDGSALLADGHFQVAADGSLTVTDTNKNNMFTITAADGAVTAADGNFTIDSTGAVTAASGTFTNGLSAASGLFSVDGTSGTITLGTDESNQTIISGGRFQSIYTDEQGKQSIVDLTAGYRDIALYDGNGTDSRQYATATRILNTVKSDSDSDYVYSSTDIRKDSITDTIKEVSRPANDRDRVSSSDNPSSHFNITKKTLDSTADTIENGADTTTVTESATSFSVQGASGHGLATDTTTGQTTVATTDGTTTLDGGTASFVNGADSVSIKNGSAVFTSATAGTSSKQGTTTTIDGGTISTDTLTVQKIVLGETMVDSTGAPIDGTGSALTISSDGSIRAASGNFQVSKEGYVTNHFAGNSTGDTVDFSTDTNGVQASYVNDGNGQRTTSTLADGMITASVSSNHSNNMSVETATGSQNTIINTAAAGIQVNMSGKTSTESQNTIIDTTQPTTHINSIMNTASDNTTIVASGAAAGTNELTASAATTTLSDGTNTSAVTTTAVGGTKFTSTTADTAFNGGSATSTVINGNTITTGQLTTDSLVITGSSSTGSTAGGQTNGAIVMGGDGSFSSKVKSAMDSTITSTFASNINGVTAEATRGTNAAKNDVTATAVTSEVTDGTYTGSSDVTASQVTHGVANANGSVQASSVNTVDAATNLANTTDTVKDGNGSNVTVHGSTTNAQTITDTAGNSNSIIHDATGSSATVTNGTSTNTTVTNAVNTTQTIGTTTFTNDTTGAATTVAGHTATVTGSDVTINSGETGQIRLSDMGQVSNINTNIQGSTVVDSLNTEYAQRVAADINLSNRIDDVSGRLNRVGAMSAAIANLKTMGYDPAAPTEITAAVGGYKGDKAIALGINHYSNRDVMLTISYAQSGSENMGGFGATFRVGRSNAKDVIEEQRRKTQKRIEEAQARAIAAHELYQKAAQDAVLDKKEAALDSNKEIRQSAKEEADAKREYENVKEKYNKDLAPSFQVKN